MEFLDRQNQMWLDALEEDVKQELFDNWLAAQSDEGPEYVEHRLMSYASEDMQKLYNEYYGMTMGDEYYFVAESEHEEYMKYVNEELAKFEGRDQE